MFDLGSKRVLGVDFGTKFLKIVDLEIKKPKPILRDYGIVSLPNEMMIGDEAGKILGLTLDQLGIKTKLARVTIPASSIFPVFFTLPKLTEKELKDAVILEAKRYLPINLKDVHLTWQYMRVEGENETERTRVFLVAIPRDILNQYERMLKVAGLQADRIEFFGFSLARATKNMDNFSVIVDIGNRPSTAFFVRDGNIYDMRNLKFSGAGLDAALSELFQMTFDRVEELKNQIGLLPYPEYTDATKTMQSMVDNFLLSLNSEIEAFEVEFRSVAERIFLTGGSCAMKGFFGRAGDTLNQRKVLPLNPFAFVEYPAGLEDTLAERRPVLAQALSVAMPEISL